MRNKKGQFIKGNKPIGGFKKGHEVNVGRKHNKEWNDNIGKSNKGRISPMKGKRMPESAKTAIGNALRGKPALKIRGDKHYNWKNGRSKLQKIVRHLVEYKNWRDGVFKRDNFTCQKCGQWGGKLNADHYPMPFWKILDKHNIKTVEQALNCKKLWDLSNGRTLCFECHCKTREFHSNQYVNLRKTSSIA